MGSSTGKRGAVLSGFCRSTSHIGERIERMPIFVRAKSRQKEGSSHKWECQRRRDQHKQQSFIHQGSYPATSTGSSAATPECLSRNPLFVKVLTLPPQFKQMVLCGLGGRNPLFIKVLTLPLYRWQTPIPEQD